MIVGLGNGMTGMFTDLYNTMGSDLLAINLYTSGTRTVSVDEMHRLIEAKPEYFRSLSPIYGASTQMKVGSKEYRFTRHAPYRWTRCTASSRLNRSISARSPPSTAPAPR